MQTIAAPMKQCEQGETISLLASHYQSKSQQPRGHLQFLNFNRIKLVEQIFIHFYVFLGKDLLYWLYFASAATRTKLINGHFLLQQSFFKNLEPQSE